MLVTFSLTCHEACVDQSRCQYILGFYPYFDYIVKGYDLSY